MAEEREYSDAEIDEIERTEYKEEQIAFYEKQQITLLDHYAALILAGFLANDDSDIPYQTIVESAFDIAQQCIAERSNYGIER